jgi:hypothetical protein
MLSILASTRRATGISLAFTLSNIRSGEMATVQFFATWADEPHGY